jgi:hypothetical protein
VSTPAEDLANALAATSASFTARFGARAEAARLARLTEQNAAWTHPVLKGWEIHVLTCIVWTPQVLTLFVDRLRPEVLTLAQAIVVMVQNEAQYLDHFPPRELAAACDFVLAVDKAWPEMARRREDGAAWAAVATPRRLNT